MAMDDILFNAHLEYLLDAGNEADTENSIKRSDISKINLHKCRFDDFKKAMLFMKDENPDYSFNEFGLDAVKPVDFIEDKIYDFVELTDKAKQTAINIVNMSLFSELQKIASAIEQFLLMPKDAGGKKQSVVKPFSDYDNYDIQITPDIAMELGSCVIGGGSAETYKLTATFHESSRDDRPIISVRLYSISAGSYLPNMDIVDIESIYKQNATLMEVFAYMSYQDYASKVVEPTFDKLLISGSIMIDSLEDMYAKHYDLRIFDHVRE